MEDEVLTYDAVAGMLGVPRNTLYSMVSRKQIPHIRMSKRLVRFRRSVIEAWLRERTFASDGGEPATIGVVADGSVAPTKRGVPSGNRFPKIVLRLPSRLPP